MTEPLILLFKNSLSEYLEKFNFSQIKNNILIVVLSES